MDGVESLKGRLLVANPAMPDPNFHRTVVLMLAHREDGALGVVLNRPSELDVDSPLPQWKRLAAAPAVVFVGGPVAPGAAICLARVPGAAPPDDLSDLGGKGPAAKAGADAASGDGSRAGSPSGGAGGGEPPDADIIGLGSAAGWIPLLRELGTLDLEGDPDELPVEVEAIRVFAGYAGWGAGQLESEIEADAWFVVRAEPEDALAGDPGSLWKRVLRRQGGRLALVAAYPEDPRHN